MQTTKMQLACLLMIGFALAVCPTAALAQQGKAPGTGEKINLNTATIEQLQTLPGIGPATAKSILDYRAKVGKFNKVEEILNIKGIGEKKYQQIKDRLTV